MARLQEIACSDDYKIIGGSYLSISFDKIIHLIEKRRRAQP